MGTTPDMGIPELAPSQATPDITHNEAIVLMQALLNGVLDKDLTAPPGAPTEGDSYIINSAAPTGAWTGHAYAVAIFWGGSWRFVPGNDDAGTPIVMGARQEGIAVWVRDEDKRYTWNGAAWAVVLSFTAADVSFTPVGTIAATNVQAAIAEAASEAVQVAGHSALSVVGNATNATGPAADIAAGTDGFVLRRSGTAVGFGTLAAGAFAANTIALANLANAGAQYDIVGRKTASGGAWEDCTRPQLLLAGTDLGNAFTAAQSVTIDTQFPIVINRPNNATVGAYYKTEFNTASPAAGDYFGGAQFHTRDGAGTMRLGASFEATIIDPAAATFTVEEQFFVLVNNANASRLNIRAGIYSPNATGGDKGADTANFLAYYVGGVNLTAVYVAKSGDTMTGPLNVTQTAGGSAFSNAGLGITNTDAGVFGPSIGLYHNSASPAIGDVISSLRSFSNNSTPAAVQMTNIAAIMTGVTAGAESAGLNFITIQAGAAAIRWLIEQGIYSNGLTDQGAGTINTSGGHFVSGRVAVDSNSLLRRRGFTFGTLPAAVSGAMAYITDSSAAFTWGTPSAGGGAGITPVIALGATWYNG